MKTDTIVWHPSYDYQTLDHDIMLIKLYHSVSVDSFVRPVSLPRGCPSAGMECVVSGWGNTLSDGAGIRTPQPSVFISVIETRRDRVKQTSVWALVPSSV
ncbi:UNVERIFIED_CONTAM: hypothetical protein FKN15_012601 [Acipenser sinensis]